MGTCNIAILNVGKISLKLFKFFPVLPSQEVSPRVEDIIFFKLDTFGYQALFIMTALILEKFSLNSLDINSIFVWVTEQHYVSIFFTHLWSVRNPLLFDTQNPGISEFSTAHAYKYKTKRQAKMKQKQQKKMTFLLISHQATLVLNKHRFVLRP